MSQDQSPALPVFDGLLRLIHAWNGVAILALIATGLVAEELGEGPIEDAVWHWHMAFGYTLLGGLAARLIWGLLGPDTARLSDFWHPRAWLRVLRERALPAPAPVTTRSPAWRSSRSTSSSC